MPTWYLAGTERFRGPVPAGVAVYQGPGDVVSGAAGWWGLRAYSAAKAAAGTAAVQLIDSALANATDIHLLSNGILDLTDPFFSLRTPPYYVNILYDQTGNGLHLSGTSRPIFNLTGNGLSVPSMSFVRTSALFLRLGSNTFSVSLPSATFNVVFNRTFGGVANALLDTGTITINAHTAANFVYMFNGGGGSINETTATDGSWHTAQAVFTATTSDNFTVDNKTTITGTSTGTGNVVLQDIYLGSNAASDHLDGFMSEAGIWPVGFTAPNVAAMYANQHAYYGAF